MIDKDRHNIIFEIIRQEVNQLVIYMSGREDELGTTENKSS